jgi:hypothetical protein
VLVVVTGGQAPAHAPVHADMPLVSLTHRYTARPDPSVRNVLPPDEAVLMTVAADALAPPLAGALLGADAPAGVLLDAAGVLLLPALEHAAANSATPTAPPTPVASLAGADMRLMDFLIVFVSCPARPSRASSNSPK